MGTKGRARKSIGLIINDVDGNIQPILLNNVRRAAEVYDCNLFILEGRNLNSDIGNSKQHNIVYKLLDKSRIDGIIMASCFIMDKVGYEGILKFCRQYEDIPMVSIGMEIPGAINLLVDNKSGMKSLVRHMVEDHGYRRVAFIKGPETNNEANERFEGYLEVLKENNIEADESLIFKGNWEAESGFGIMQRIVTEGIRYDALISANDDMAHGGIAYLNQIGASDVSIDLSQYYTIAGYDDTLNSIVIKPLLTTIKQPMEEIGLYAVKMLLERIDGKQTESTLKFPSVLVKRESCGCANELPSYSLPHNSSRVFTHNRLPDSLSTFSIEELLDKLTSALPGCFIKSCFISKYLGEVAVSQEVRSVPEKSELIYMYSANMRMHIDEKYKDFDTKEIIPHVYIPDRRFTFIVKPIFFTTQHFGFVCFEGSDEANYLYESLRSYLSNTLKGAILLAEIEEKSMKEIQNEREKLSSLGHLIGGISHNLNTPIMSNSVEYSTIEELIEEYTESLKNPQVTTNDHFEIAKEMKRCIGVLKKNNSYMSDVISAIKDQAIQLNADTNDEFTVQELMSQIRLYINSDLKARKCLYNISLAVPDEMSVKGDLSNLTKVLYNMINNACEAYYETKCTKPVIDICVEKNRDNLLFVVRDYGKGIECNVRSKIFNQMVTTKGRNGAGLSLLLSYIAIKARFRGDIWFDTVENQGTTFHLSIPLDVK